MLKLKNITKRSSINKENKKILDDVNISFNENELVFILGPSGSGKSTLLNIILGNITDYQGEVWLDNICISKLKKNKLNDYHTNIVSNIFQEYNLIEYMSVIDNIKIGYNGKLNTQDVTKILTELNLDDCKNVIVSKLSGGEKQRVAIARSLVRNSKIILADEPTGALDYENSIIVMDVLKKLANNHLVIVVSHDTLLANKYADRIINICDGKCSCDCEEVTLKNNYTINKRKTNYFKLFKLSIKNLLIKYARTLFTSLAISLGFISLFLVLNLYSNINKEIDNLKNDMAYIAPITVINGLYELENDNYAVISGMVGYNDKNVYNNMITEDYLNYLNEIKEIKYINYDYDMLLPFITDSCYNIDNKYIKFINNKDYITNNYELIYGSFMKDKYDVLLKVDSNNNVISELLNYFKINGNVKYEDIIGRKIKYIINNDYFMKNNKSYKVNSNNNLMYESSNIELNIVGIIKEKVIIDDNNYLYFNNELLDEVIKINSQSDIVLSMLDNEEDKEMLAYLGYNTLPNRLDIYVSNIDNRSVVKNKLDNYNLDNHKVIYEDTMMESIDMVKKFILIISIILIMFSVVSFVISGILIIMLTSIRVLERKHEIGILRSLGYSTKEVKRIFNIENGIIYIIASLIGLIVILILVKPLNNLVYNYSLIDSLFKIDFRVLLLVFLFNLLINKLSGIIPISKINKLDIVNCLNSR